MASSPTPTPWIVSDDCYDIDIIDSILLDHHLEPEADSMPPKHEESDLHVNKKQKVHLYANLLVANYKKS